MKTQFHQFTQFYFHIQLAFALTEHCTTSEQEEKNNGYNTTELHNLSYSYCYSPENQLQVTMWTKLLNALWLNCAISLRCASKTNTAFSVRPVGQGLLWDCSGGFENHMEWEWQRTMRTEMEAGFHIRVIRVIWRHKGISDPHWGLMWRVERGVVAAPRVFLVAVAKTDASARCK